MNMTSFWQTIELPIFGLAPMDGVSDAPFRLMTARYGKPDVITTEFCHVDAIWMGNFAVLDDFIYDESERPVVGQIYGSRPEQFYKAVQVVCELGFDGIDINMGCPDKHVAAHGSGAGLIRDPLRAKQIVQAVRQGIVDWANGQTLGNIGYPAKKIAIIRALNEARVARYREWLRRQGRPAPAGLSPEPVRRNLPISIKTRIGYDQPVIEEWISHLLEVEPAAITIHGRTLKQMYSGQADWEAIARAAALIRQTPTLALGNGDLKTPTEIGRRIVGTGVQGVVVGRGTLGNPWFFANKEAWKQTIQAGQVPPEEPTPGEDRLLRAALEHGALFTTLKSEHRFVEMRKHLGWYCKYLPGARHLRTLLMQADSLDEVEELFRPYLDGRALPSLPKKHTIESTR